MFRRIGSVKNFGVFHDYSGGQLPEFANFNLLYGWNYSGKTTLSRLFRCLEKGELHPDYSGAKFSLSHHDGNLYEQDFAIPCNVRVFNEDFRKENLRWDDTSGFTPILLLGSENIEKRDELTRKEGQREKISTELTDGEKEATRLEKTISEAETECARQIARELGIARFDRRHVRPIIEGWNGEMPEPLDDESFQNEKRRAVATEEKPVLPDLQLKIGAIEEIWSAASALVAEQLGTSGTITRLVERPDIGNWVEQGLHLHVDATHCEFCENPLKPERILVLRAFSVHSGSYPHELK